MLRALAIAALAITPWTVLAAPTADIDPDGAIVVRGLGAPSIDDASSTLTVRVVGLDGMGAPVMGRVDRAAEGARFVPRFPLSAGHRYAVTWRGARSARVGLEVTTPAPVVEVSRVTGFGPATPALAANTLRIYVYFDAPMQRTDATAHVALLDDAGQPIDQPFFVADGELWSADGTRLALLFDPGRVKSGLAAHDRLGRALSPGGGVRLVVRETMPDAHGRPLGRRFEHRWAVGPADLDPPDPDRWRFATPDAGTHGVAVLELDAPVDAAILRAYVDIVGPDGEPLAGTVDVNPAGDRWTFVPDAPWRSGDYRWRVDARLEDHAGNALDGLFDRPAHIAPRRFAGGVYARRFTL